jgi:hypothetical protein
MPLARKLIELHGGSIEARRRPGAVRFGSPALAAG